MIKNVRESTMAVCNVESLRRVQVNNLVKEKKKNHGSTPLERLQTSINSGTFIIPEFKNDFTFFNWKLEIQLNVYSPF